MDEYKDRTDEILEKRLNRKDRRPKKKGSAKAKKPVTEMYPEQEVTEVEEPKKKKGCFGIVIRILLLLVLAAAIWVGVGMGREYFRKSRPGGKDVEITIEKGEGLSAIIKELKEKGILKYRLPFTIKVQLSGRKKDLRYGTFTLNNHMSLDEILDILTSQSANKDQYTLTVPEGYSVQKIGRLLEKKGIMDADVFLKEVKNYQGDFAYKDDLPDPAKADYVLQGYLFPDTYYLYKDITAATLIEKMLDNFEKHFPAKKKEKAAAMGMTVNEVVNRASLVQKETVLPEEYPIVADVLTNRLDINMNLQLDSTVLYALTDGEFNKDKVYHSDLKTDSPYNTYTHKGLPPGPICCPGEEALDAVLEPDDNHYLYFQTDSQAGDGSNLFFETYEEHSSAQATTGTQEADTAAVPEEATKGQGPENSKGTETEGR